MRKPDSVTLGIIIVSVVIFGGILIAATKQGGLAIIQYGSSDAERPRLEIAETSFDFGKITLADKKIREIKIKNNGAKTLVISDLITSCDCTFVQLIIDGRESPRFSMRRDSKWRGEIAPTNEAILRIVYEPKIMPVQGKVKREIVFKTNDPEKSLVNIRFIADVK